MMEYQSPEEEEFREACCFGDTDKISALLSRHVNINSQHPINKWTGLHWACKRNHIPAVRLLVSFGANVNLTNIQNETPANLTRDVAILKLLHPEQQFLEQGNESETSSLTEMSDTKFVPSYLRHSVRVTDEFTKPEQKLEDNDSTKSSSTHGTRTDQELILKIRVADTGDPDFIEVDFPKSTLSYSSLLTNCCQELNVNPQMVERMRKLPNTRMRNDKDVNRLQDYQELEFIVKGKSKKLSGTSNNGTSIHNLQTRTILY